MADGIYRCTPYDNCYNLVSGRIVKVLNMSKDQQISYMIEQLRKIAESNNPHIMGALFQLIAKQTLKDVGSE